MKSINKVLYCSSLLLLSLLLTSCITETQAQKKNQPTVEESAASPATTQAVSLPVRYQTAGYLVDKKAGEDQSIAEEGKLKVGARITSTRGPQPLMDIMKRLAALKGMNVSWSSDVDQNVLVDVNISAEDDFFLAVDNLLRQVDYYHEMQGSTIIVKYKETRLFHIAMPFIKQTYKTNTGGDVLGGGGDTSVSGEISLSSEGVAVNQHKDGKPGGVEFNTWDSIENNLNAILSIWTTDEEASKPATESNSPVVIIQQKSTRKSGKIETTTDEQPPPPPPTATFRRSSGGNNYFIDKPVGLITVTAPRPLLERLEVYFKTLQKELYKQVSIEAKILEVQLDDSSSIGLNWNLILRNLTVGPGAISGAKTYNKTTTDGTNSASTQTSSSNVTDTSTRTRDITNELTDSIVDGVSGANSSATGSSTSNIVSNIAGSAASSGISAAQIITEGLTGSLSGAISLAAFSFDSFLNAVSEQGQATILSNPKLSVLNGQPALITVGRNVTYISKIESDVIEGAITTTAETDSVLSGLGLALTANILDDKQIILNIVPVTSELEEPIEYRPIGLGEIGLPIMNVREMSTTVRVNNGEMLVIGGLISSVARDGGTFVPGTSKIPFFKYLFGYETKLAQKRELIILLKPRII